jgi:hypothetical protein
MGELLPVLARSRGPARFRLAELRPTRLKECGARVKCTRGGDHRFARPARISCGERADREPSGRRLQLDLSGDELEGLTSRVQKKAHDRCLAVDGHVETRRGIAGAGTRRQSKYRPARWVGELRRGLVAVKADMERGCQADPRTVHIGVDEVVVRRAATVGGSYRRVAHLRQCVARRGRIIGRGPVVDGRSGMIDDDGVSVATFGRSRSGISPLGGIENGWRPRIATLPCVALDVSSRAQAEPSTRRDHAGEQRGR